jgi:hypothetical protein
VASLCLFKTPKTIHTENILDVGLGKELLDITSKSSHQKQTLQKKVGLHQAKSFLHSKRNNNRKKIACRLEDTGTE